MEIQKIERSSSAQYGVKAFSWQGITSGIFLIIQIILLFTAVYLSYLEQGNGSIIVGILGVLAFVMAMAGMILAIWGLSKKEQNHAVCLTGGIGSFIIASAIILICTVL